MPKEEIAEEIEKMTGIVDGFTGKMTSILSKVIQTMMELDPHYNEEILIKEAPNYSCIELHTVFCGTNLTIVCDYVQRIKHHSDVLDYDEYVVQWVLEDLV